MRRLALLVVLLLCIVPASLHATESANVVIGDHAPIFGAVEAYYRPEEAEALGLAWDRMIFYWYDFQPSSRLQFRTEVIDEAIFAEAQRANRQIVGIIKGTPIWASAERLPGGVPYGVRLPFDHPANFWGSFVRRLVRHYSALGVHHWVIWNEPDIRADDGGVPEFLGTVEDFYYMVRVAYQAIKSEDPSAHVQLPGMQWWGDRNRRREPYLSRLLRYIYNDPQAAANNYYFDGIGIHLHFTTGSVWNTFMEHIEILRRFGLGTKEIWLDEFGASPRRDPMTPTRGFLQIDLQQQADYIVHASATALAADADRIAVYRLYDNHFTLGESEPWGLVRGDGTLRPAYYAYQQVIRRFSGAQRVRRYHNDRGTLVIFEFPERTLYVMWSNTFRGGEFLINANRLEGEVAVADAAGTETMLPLVEEGGARLAIIEAPGARRIDWPAVVVAGSVRLVELPGGPRSVWYRTDEGEVFQLR